MMRESWNAIVHRQGDGRRGSIYEDDDSICALFFHGRKRVIQFFRSANHDRSGIEVHGLRIPSNSLGECLAERIGRKTQDRDTLAFGNTSRTTSRSLEPNSGLLEETPVTFPPGRARLATSPVPTGSPTGAMTIGISCVAFFAAIADGVSEATMMSTLARTRSVASSGSRFASPSAERTTN